MGVELYEIKPTLVQLQHDQDRRQFGGDFRRLCNSFIQGGGSLIQRGASRIQIGGSSTQFGGSSRELARQDLRPGSPNGVCGLLQL